MLKVSVTEITLQRYELKILLAEAVRVGVAQFLQTSKGDIISERVTKRLYGSHIDRWVKNGFIECTQNDMGRNSRKNFSYKKLVEMAKRDGMKEKKN